MTYSSFFTVEFPKRVLYRGYLCMLSSHSFPNKLKLLWPKDFGQLKFSASLFLHIMQLVTLFSKLFSIVSHIYIYIYVPLLPTSPSPPLAPTPYSWMSKLLRTKFGAFFSSCCVWSPWEVMHSVALTKIYMVMTPKPVSQVVKNPNYILDMKTL